MPYWPYSPSIGRDGEILTDVAHFTGTPVVVTEKLDGSNTLLHRGQVFGRSVTSPSTGKWMAMVKKHHAWKLLDHDVVVYGEDIYGVHSIEYEPVPEHATFYAFALRNSDGSFAAFQTMVDYARRRDIPVVPVLFEGVFRSIDEIQDFIRKAHEQPSRLGGIMEGVVMRLARGFPPQSSGTASARAFELGMSRQTNIGRGTGGPAGSRAVNACARSGGPAGTDRGCSGSCSCRGGGSADALRGPRLPVGSPLIIFPASLPWSPSQH